MLRKLAPLALCISSLVCATDKATIITSKYLMASSQGYLVTHDKKGFKVDGKPVHKYDLDASLRNLSRSRINDLLEKDNAKLEVTRVGHDYSIKCREQLRGGGPIAANSAYWVTKSLLYGGTATAVTAGAGVAVAAVAPLVGAGAATGTITAVMTAAPAAVGAPGATVAAAVLGTSAVTTEAAVVATTSLATAGGGIAGATMAIESASLAVASFFLWLPIP